MVPKLHRLDRWCLCFPSRLCPARRYQDSYPEQELREPREWIPDSVKHGQERRFLQFLQGIGS